MSYCFAIHSGMPGYLPNSTDLYSFETIDEAKTAIREEVERWLDGTPDGVGRHIPWGMFANGPDASMWSFDVARGHGNEMLTVAGLTEAEWQARMDEED